MIVGAAWSSDLFGRLSALGFTGNRLMDLTDAVGNGSQAHVVGKAFTTMDSGTVPGSGTGIGNGITGIDPSLVANIIFATAAGLFGTSGNRLQDLCDALGQNVVAQMLTALLTSTHSPVFSGTGTVVVGSVTVLGPAWGSSIQGAGAGEGLVGNQWPNLATAIGHGFFTGVISGGTGTVSISGSPSGTPSGGSGSGAGTIS